MSTWIYLQCADHNPPLVAPYEVGQHLSDLPQIFADLRDRGRIVKNCHGDIFPDDYFRKHTAQFLAQHPQCQIEVWDEYGRQHTDPNKGELMTDEPTKPCECRWYGAAQRRDRMQMGGMVIAPCDEYGRTDREAKPSLTDEQAEALQGAVIGLRQQGLTARIDNLRAAFPRAFEPEPGAGVPDEVAKAAWSAFDDGFGEMRAALAAADAKRAELEGPA